VAIFMIVRLVERAPGMTYCPHPARGRMAGPRTGMYP